MSVVSPESSQATQKYPLPPSIAEGAGQDPAAPVSFESRQKIMLAIDEVRCKILIGLKAKKIPSPEILTLDQLSKYARQCLAFSVLAEETEGVLGLGDFLCAIEDDDVGFSMTALSLFSEIVDLLPSPAAKDLFPHVLTRIVAVIDRLSDGDLVQHGHRVAGTLCQMIVVRHPLLCTGFLDRRAIWESIAHLSCVLKGGGHILDGFMRLSILKKTMFWLAAVVEHLPFQALRRLEHLLLVLLHPDGHLCRLQLYLCDWSETHADEDPQIQHRYYEILSALFVCMLSLFGRLIRFLSNDFRNPENVDLRILMIATATIKSDGDMYVIMHDFFHKFHCDEILRQPLGPATQKAMKTYRKTMKECRGTPLEMAHNSMHLALERSRAIVYCGACGIQAHGTSSLQKCSGCGILRYCSRSCQKEHWDVHKSECLKLKSLKTSLQ